MFPYNTYPKESDEFAGPVSPGDIIKTKDDVFYVMDSEYEGIKERMFVKEAVSNRESGRLLNFMITPVKKLGNFYPKLDKVIPNHHELVFRYEDQVTPSFKFALLVEHKGKMKLIEKKDNKYQIRPYNEQKDPVFTSAGIFLSPSLVEKYFHVKKQT